MGLLNKYSIVLLFVFALLLRCLNFSSLTPPSINWDEASLGYNAYSILKTGRDEWGRFLPLTFQAFGDYKLPGYIYTLVPFVALFGLNELSIRLPSIIFGSLSVIFLFLIVEALTRDKKWALISAGLLAISPWHFFLSRIALEANLALGFFLIGFYVLIRGLKKSSLLIPASLLMGTSIFTYNSARIFVPLFLFVLLLIYRKQIKISKWAVFAGLIFAGFLIAGFYLAVFQDSSARYYWVKILDEGAINYLEQSRNNSILNPLIANLIYNRVTYFIFNFFSNYLKHLSLQFLIISGGSNYQFSLPDMGLMYFAELPFLIFGFFKLLRQKVGWVFLSWFLIAPIPAALTREAPHALRSIFMLGSIQIITAFGFLQVSKLLVKKKLLLNSIFALVGIAIILNAAIYLKTYFYDYLVEYSKAWQYGYKQAVEQVDKNYDKYPKIYFTKYYGEPHIFYLFFSKYDPQKYQVNKSLIRYEKSNWRWVDRLDKIYFLNDWEIKEKLKNERNALVIAAPGNVPEGSKLIDTIYFPNGSKAFEIVKI